MISPRMPEQHSSLLTVVASQFRKSERANRSNIDSDIPICVMHYQVSSVIQIV